jgi:hypothetical protein
VSPTRFPVKNTGWSLLGMSRIKHREKCRQPKIQSFIRFGRSWVPIIFVRSWHSEIPCMTVLQPRYGARRTCHIVNSVLMFEPPQNGFFTVKVPIFVANTRQKCRQPKSRLKTRHGRSWVPPAQSREPYDKIKKNTPTRHQLSLYAFSHYERS